MRGVVNDASFDLRIGAVLDDCSRQIRVRAASPGVVVQSVDYDEAAVDRSHVHFKSIVDSPVSLTTASLPTAVSELSPVLTHQKIPQRCCPPDQVATISAVVPDGTLAV